jgi:hypothetical protein
VSRSPDAAGLPGAGTPARIRRRPPAAGALLAALVLAAGIAAAAPAAAHSPRVRVEVLPTPPATPGGATRVGAIARYDDDGHLAPGLTMKGVATQGGERVSFTLRPATRPGAYAAGVRLAPGRWGLRVTASGSSTGTATVQVATPATTTTAPAPSPSASPETVTAAPPTGSSNGSTILIVAVAVVAALAAILLAASVRRRAA